MLIIVLSLLYLSGCSRTPVQGTTVPAAVTATTQAPTATASLTPTPTNTPTPTRTRTPTPTATPTPNITATQSALATATTIAALEIIAPDLEKYGFSPEQGQLGWFRTEPFTMTLDSFRENQMYPMARRQSFADFVLQSDITWNTQEGLAGCGFSLRSGPDLTRDLHYEFFLVRLEGLPLWEIALWQGSRSVRSLMEEVESSPHINQKQGATNRIALVVQGDQFTFYANGERVRTLTDSGLQEGLLAFMAGQNSGKTTCTFTNTWIWDLKSIPPD